MSYLDTVGRFIARAAAIIEDCKILGREPTEEEVEFLADLGFLLGNGEKPLGIINHPIGAPNETTITN